MKFCLVVLFSGVLLLGGVAQAASGTGSPDLLARATSGPAPEVTPLTTDELADIRGEGTIEKFIALPRLRRSFERIVVRDQLTVSIVGVAGEGITIRIDSPHIP